MKQTEKGEGTKGEQTHRMSLKLNLQLGPILENPLHNVRIWGGILYSLGLDQSGPKVAEGLKLDEVPDGAEGGRYDG